MWEEPNLGKICEALEIDPLAIANGYVYGSVKLGLQSAESDVDVMLVTHAPISALAKEQSTSRIKRTPLKIGEVQFYETSQNYFHSFDLRACTIDGRKYDVIVYDQFQFRTVLQSHFMVNVECLFSLPSFILKQDLDFLPFYFDSCLRKDKIFHAIDEEINYCLGMTRSALNGPPHRRVWASKKIFNTARYFSTVFQLLRDGTISTFTELNSLKGEVKQLVEGSGTIHDALDLAIERVTLLLLRMNADHHLDEDLSRINSLIEKWGDI